MSLVTPENVTQRAGWTITPLGRILRPVKMRPARPLPPATELHDKKRADGEGKKKRKRVKDPESRARRRTIDMTRWGSVYLKGSFLAMEVVGAGRQDANKPLNVATDLELAAGTSSDSGTETESEAADVPVEDAQAAEPISQSDPPPASVLTLIPGWSQTSQSQAPPATSQTSLLSEEKSHNLTLLASLFGGKTNLDWVGREDLGSDVDEDELMQKRVFEMRDGREVKDGEEEFEVVPMNGDEDEDFRIGDEEENAVELMHVDMNGEQKAAPKSDVQALSSTTKQQHEQKQTKLKDLFASHEEEGM